jgi:hypothetical protein
MMIGRRWFTCYALLILLALLSRNCGTSSAEVASSESLASQDHDNEHGQVASEERPSSSSSFQKKRPTQQQRTRKLPLQEGDTVTALPSCCHLVCPSGVTYGLEGGRRLATTGGEEESDATMMRSLRRGDNSGHDISYSSEGDRFNCQYNCDACGQDCCSCFQVSSPRRKAVEMQCTCTPGCNDPPPHHHHHHHVAMLPHHHHHHIARHHHHHNNNHHHHSGNYYRRD